MTTMHALDVIKEDLYRILNAPSVTRDEVLNLLETIRAGRIDGSCYINYDEEFTCGCLVGTIALYRDVALCDLDFSVSYNFPIETFVGLIEYGDTPATNERLANVAAWIEEWLGVREAAQS